MPNGIKKGRVGKNNFVLRKTEIQNHENEKCKNETNEERKLSQG